jgi:hypothetical protein
VIVRLQFMGEGEGGLRIERGDVVTAHFRWVPIRVPHYISYG